MILADKRAAAVEYAKHFIGTPYEWSGDNPQGADCSGFVGMVYRGVGLLGNREDISSQMFFDRWQQHRVHNPTPGAFVVFGKQHSEITHIALIIDDEHILEAGGGNRTTKTPGDADKQNAFVRMRPINTRKDWLGNI